jgi:hypothetical protein
MDGLEAMAWITEMFESSNDVMLVFTVVCLLLHLIGRTIVYALDRTGLAAPPLSVDHEFMAALRQSRMLTTARLEDDSAEEEGDDDDEVEEDIRSPSDQGLARRSEEDGRESYAGSKDEETGIQTTSGRPTRTRRPNPKYTGPTWVQ